MEKVKLREERNVGVWGGEDPELMEEVEGLRAMYEELEVEHEDLLALLAQQQLEKETLQSALLSHGGEVAVEDAQREAEEICISRFDQFIRMDE
jgi:hypothetical protein